MAPVAGVLAGSAVALWGSACIAPLLYGLPPYDPLTFTAAAIILAAAGAFAGWLPARRTSRIDPAQISRT